MTVPDDVVPKRPRFLTVEQVAEELAVGLPTVRQLLKSGELRGLQIGGRGMWRVATKDLEDYIEQAYRVTAERIAAGEVPDEDSVE
ncbi:helix-turn-helix domain-containing protein [Arthrobacter sp. CDRTa11]|uniref:helix-turn-helix domain-containing protein n=1 Tax=Arthrobacter sp. CDRTa11 TaxID=2651199 RepID=UPI0022657F2B|nr:helix-turn-helix domain-containing protein [Arthrobacter sp. CDRTa11]